LLAQGIADRWRRDLDAAEDSSPIREGFRPLFFVYANRSRPSQQHSIDIELDGRRQLKNLLKNNSPQAASCGLVLELGWAAARELCDVIAVKSAWKTARGDVS